MPVNAGVLNFFGNLLQGFTEGRQQAQEQQERKEYKKLLMKQMQAEFDAKEAQAQAVIDWQKNPSDPILGMKAGVFKKPTDALLFQMFGGQPQQQQQLPPSIGMNYEEPTTPVVEQQPTFPAQLTGTPTADDWDTPIPGTPGITRRQLINSELLKSNPDDAVRSIVTVDPETNQVVYGSQLRSGKFKVGNKVYDTVPYLEDTRVSEEPNPAGPFAPPNMVTRGVKSGRVVGTRPGVNPLETKEITDTSGARTEHKKPKYSTWNKPSLDLSGGPQPGQPIVFDNEETEKQLYDVLSAKYGRTGVSGGSGLVIKPGEADLPIKEEERAQYIHPDMLTSPPPETSPNAAYKMGYKKISTQARNTVDGVNSVRSVIDQIQTTFHTVFGPEKQASSNLWDRTRRGIVRKGGSVLQTWPEAANLESLIGGTLAPIIRSLGEKGTLAEGDVERAINLMPKLTDNDAVAWGKLRQLESLIDGIQKSVVAGKYQQGIQNGSNKPSMSLKNKPKPIDDATIMRYLKANGNDPKKAKEAARKDGFMVE